MKLGFFLRESLRSMRRNAVPSFAALATVLVTVLVLGVFIPVVQVDERRGQRRAQAASSSASTSRTARPPPRSRGCAQLLRGTRRTSRPSSSSPRRGVRPAEQGRPGGLRDRRLEPAAGHLPGDAGQARQRQPSRRPGADERATARSTRRSPRSTTVATTPRRSSTATSLVKVTMARARDAAGDRVGPPDLEHDPPVPVRPPPRGRGDEARRRDRLVHPLAVRDRGRPARRRSAACWRSAMLLLAKFTVVDSLVSEFSVIGRPSTINFPPSPSS